MLLCGDGNVRKSGNMDKYVLYNIFIDSKKACASVHKNSLWKIMHNFTFYEKKRNN